MFLAWTNNIPRAAQFKSFMWGTKTEEVFETLNPKPCARKKSCSWVLIHFLVSTCLQYNYSGTDQCCFAILSQSLAPLSPVWAVLISSHFHASSMLLIAHEAHRKFHQQICFLPKKISSISSKQFYQTRTQAGMMPWGTQHNFYRKNIMHNFGPNIVSRF